MYLDTEKQNKIRDIESVEFGNNLNEIVSSLEIIVTLLQIDDDPEIIFSCKKKLAEGIELLKKMGYGDKTKDFEIEIK